MRIILRTFTRVTLHFLAGSAIALAGYAIAQPAATTGGEVAEAYSVDDLVGRYPENSIQSSESASKALAEVQEARTYIETRFASEQQACYPKFFTTSCLNKAIERRRVDLARVRPIEVQANAYTRKAKVVERDRKLAEKAAKDEADASQREQQSAQKAVVIRDRETADLHSESTREAQRKKRAADAAKKNEQHAIKVEKLKDREAKEAEERAENVVKYDKKQREAEARQEEVAKKKAERERKRQSKLEKTQEPSPQ